MLHPKPEKTIKKPHQTTNQNHWKPNFQHIPSLPGIYKMLNKRRDIIYIGKAKHLKNRVKSYFQSSNKDLKTRIMVSQINHIDTIVTETETEALILENQLIKQHKPKYNILLKDDKTYPYLKITQKEPFPKIMVTRSKKKDQALYFGPYPSMGSTRKLQRILYQCFPIRQCKQDISLTHQEPKCLLLDIKKCIGPCIYKDTKAQYDLLINQLIMLCRGKNKQVITELKKQMIHYSAQLNFEKAAEYRDNITQLEQLSERQTVDIDSKGHLQLWVSLSSHHIIYVLVQDIIDGKLLAQKGYYQTKDTQSNTFDYLEQSILNYYSDASSYPHTILCETQNEATITDVFTSLSPKTAIETPKQGNKKQLLKMATKNAQCGLDRCIIDALKTTPQHALNTLKSQCKLNNHPSFILGFDISHLQGQDIVASSVAFKDGKPLKSHYKKFQIKSVSDLSNDPKSMYEVVYRRLKDCIHNNTFPDLILIDGGQAQFNAAYLALKELRIQEKIDIIAIAKRQEELYVLHQTTPLSLPKSNPGLQLLQQIRDESHRFAVQYQRQKRHKSALTTYLSAIPKVGPKRHDIIYQHFPTIEEFINASTQTLIKKTKLSKQLILYIQNQCKLAYNKNKKNKQSE